jgi:two-component system sensor histidine kinase BaeS
MPPPWRGGRPPWWPEGEAWPPRGRPPWARYPRRRRFFLRLLISLFGLWILSSACLALVGWLLIHLVGTSVAESGARWIVYPLAVVVAIAVLLAVRELRRVASTFNNMSARLSATEQRRRSFLADVTHELRTPLAVIRGQAEGIADGVYAPTPESLKPILEAAATLEVLIEDLRTLGLAESGALALNREPVDLAVLANDLLATQPHPGITVRVDLPPDLKPVNADPVRLRGVLNNLVANAIRHTPAGGTITVSARRTSNGVEIRVTDSGAGIPPELLPRIFDRFVRGPGSRGTGLGLAIAKDIVEAHGGTIAAESAPGHGTTIRFTLPPHPP